MSDRERPSAKSILSILFDALTNQTIKDATPKPEPNESESDKLKRLCSNQPAGIPLVIGEPNLRLILPLLYQGVRIGGRRIPSKAKQKAIWNKLQRKKNEHRQEIVKTAKRTYFDDILEDLMKWGIHGTKNGCFERNSWYSERLGTRVAILEDCATGKCKLRIRDRPNNIPFKTSLYLNTYRAAGFYDLEAEERAMKLLKSLVTEEQYRKYVLTGMLVEHSTKSGLLYIFRRMRPTLAFRETEVEGHLRQKFIAALCLHTQGYYEISWAGSLVPTDDVIAHILLMRANEKFFWRKSTQHSHHAPQADI